MRKFTASDLSKHVGEITDAARREPVFLTHYQKVKFVLMSAEHYERLTNRPQDPRQAMTFEQLPDDELDRLLTRLEKDIEGQS